MVLCDRANGRAFSYREACAPTRPARPGLRDAEPPRRPRASLSAVRVPSGGAAARVTTAIGVRGTGDPCASEDLVLRRPPARQRRPNALRLRVHPEILLLRERRGVQNAPARRRRAGSRCRTVARGRQGSGGGPDAWACGVG